MPDPETITPEDEQERLKRLAMLQPQPLTPAPLGQPDASGWRHPVHLAADAAASRPQPISSKLQPISDPDSIGPISYGKAAIDAVPQNGLQPIGPQSPVKSLSFAERQALPLVSLGTPAGSSAFYQNKLERLADQQDNPLGSPENHPGTLGKIGHVLGRIGNIAGNVVAPATMALIPGTDLNKNIEESNLEGKYAGAKKEEDTQAEAKARTDIERQREESEEPLREAQTKNLGQKDSEALAKQGMMRDKDGNIVADPTSPVYQKQQMAQEAVKNLMDLRSAQQELAEARTEVEKAKNDPNSPAFKAAQQRLAMAQYAHDLAAKNLDLHQQQFENKKQEQELVKPSGQAQSRGSAAQAALDIMPELQSQIRSNAKELGPIMGRLARGEIAIGNVDPKIAKLYSALTSFYALNPAIHGFRNFEFVKDMPSFIGGLERDPEATIAGLEGLRPTLESVAREGKTSHKRIVEGRDTAPASSPQRPKGVPDDAEWNEQARQWQLKKKP